MVKGKKEKLMNRVESVKNLGAKNKHLNPKEAKISKSAKDFYRFPLIPLFSLLTSRLNVFAVELCARVVVSLAMANGRQQTWLGLQEPG